MRASLLTAVLLLLPACGRDGDAGERTPRAAGANVSGARAVRGDTVTVRMMMDNEGYRFDPSYLTVREGDGVRFIMVSGMPHNVAFEETLIPAASRAQLVANLAATGGRQLASPVITALDAGFVLSTAGLPTGEYFFYCGPHRAMNMHGVLTIR